MAYIIQEARSKKEIISFIRFQHQLYKGNPFFVPPIVDFELSTLLSDKNPAFKTCQAKYWVVKDGQKIVGRVAGICHDLDYRENKFVRFGWIDFIDDQKVSEMLMGSVQEWARELGAKAIHGPMGFTDLDFEGTLISGFDQLATQATIYNFPYYQTHFENLGFKKACDWIELRGVVPDEIPKRLERTASLIRSRFKLSAKKFKKNKELLKYGKQVFEVLNQAYSHLYGYYPLSDEQIEYYIKLYFDFIRKDYIGIIVNETDEVVAFAITLPSLSKAFQKANGSLFPLGFIHVLRAFFSNDHLDLFLIAVKPEYQKLGANALLFYELMQIFVRNGVKRVSSGPMMEDNRAVLNIWNGFDEYTDLQSIKRRCFIKNI